MAETRSKCLDDCWEWPGNRDAKGYGYVFGKQLRRTHRVMYELMYGPIPEGMLVCHRCDNPSCMNPSHLFLGTSADNNRDCVAKGRHISPNKLKTHCPQGHEYNEANTYNSNNRRYCRTCLGVRQHGEG